MHAALLALLISALAGIHLLIGGTRPLFAIPCYALLGVAAMLTVFIRSRVSLRAVWPTLASTLLLAGYMAVRARLSPVAYLAWPDYFEVLAGLVLYAVVVLYLHETRHLAWIFGALAVLALADVLVGLRQFSGGDDFMPLGLTREVGGRRASGFLISPNHLAGYLEVVGVYALSLACWSHWRGWVRGLLLYVAVACEAGVIVTASRGGYLSAACSLAVFGVLTVLVIGALDRRRAAIFAVAGMVVLALVIAGALELMSHSILLAARLEKLQNQFQGVQLDWRIYNWQAAWDQCKVSPLVGTGAGTHLYFGRLFRRPVIQSDPVHAHCDYLEFLGEYGWIGAALMALFLGTHLYSGARQLRRAIRQEILPTGLLLHTDVALALGGFSALGAYACHSVVDFNLHIPGNALVVALVFAALGRAAAPGLAGHTGETRFALWRLALPALGAWLCFEGLPKLPGEYWTEEMRKALKKKQFSRVVALDRKVPAGHPDPFRFFYLGEANRMLATASPLRALRAPFLEKGAASFRQSLALFPQNEIAWVRLAQTLDAQGEYGDAKTAYLTALALDPNLGVLHGYYAQHLRRLGHAREAAEMVDRARHFSNESDATIRASGLEQPLEPAPGL